MPGIKVVIGLKNGLCVQRELSEEQSKNMWGKKIGDAVDGTPLGLAGYEFLVTGGSDYCGFPMRKDISGPNRRRILSVEGVGVKKVNDGLRIKKTVAGNTIHQKIHQVNLKVVKEGAEKLEPPKKAEEAPKAAA